AGAATTTNREEGFPESVRKSPDIQVVSDNQYGGATTESALSKSESLLAANAGVNGVFAPNESTTFGMLLALQKTGQAGKLKFLGFDSSDKLLAALRAGELDGLVV